MASGKKKILVAEDEKVIANALKLKLESAGFAVSVVYDGQEALSAVEEGGLDLIILDLVMPKIDGFSFLETIKKKKVKTPVFVISNLSQGEDEKRARDLGAREYFTKSDISLAEIVAKIKADLK